MSGLLRRSILADSDNNRWLPKNKALMPKGGEKAKRPDYPYPTPKGECSNRNHEGIPI